MLLAEVFSNPEKGVVTVVVTLLSALAKNTVDAVSSPAKSQKSIA